MKKVCLYVFLPYCPSLVHVFKMLEIFDRQQMLTNRRHSNGNKLCYSTPDLFLHCYDADVIAYLIQWKEFVLPDPFISVAATYMMNFR